jgi:hypothetical protein
VKGRGRRRRRGREKEKRREGGGGEGARYLRLTGIHNDRYQERFKPKMERRF